MKFALLLALILAPSAQAATIQCYVFEGEGALQSFQFEMRSNNGAGIYNADAGPRSVTIGLEGLDRDTNTLSLFVRDMPITISLHLGVKQAKVTEVSPLDASVSLVSYFDCR